MKYCLYLASSVLILSSCATTSSSEPSSSTPAIVSARGKPEAFPVPKREPLTPISLDSSVGSVFRRQVMAVLARLGEDTTPSDALDALMSRVEEQAQFIKTQKADWFQRSLNRSSKYIHMIAQEFSQANIPTDLAYLALIESGYQLTATSHAGARGMWQFMPQTAKEYGLRVDKTVDERLDPVIATRAARAYLLDRAAIYGADSFLFVVASYNAGEGRVNRALRKLDDPIKARTFASIDALLPKETRNYVPRFLAAAAMANHPEANGFSLLAYPNSAIVRVPTKTRIDTLAQVIGSNAKRLRKLNPELGKNSQATPVSNYMLRVPDAQSDRLMAWLKQPTQLAAAVTEATQVVRSEEKQQVQQHTATPVAIKPQKATVISAVIPKGKYVRYKVQRGNNLDQIAQWFDTTVAQIKAWNPKLQKSPTLRIGQVVEVYGLPKSQRKTFHRVQPGQTLSEISLAFNVSMNKLRAWNGLKSTRLNSGQSLVVYHRGQQSQPKPARTLLYVVKYGNHLIGIAKLFGVQVADIQRWNKLHKKHLYPGQTLRIEHVKDVRVVNHTVQRGDTLSELAKKYGVSQHVLAFSNGLKATAWLQVGRTVQVVVAREV